MFSKKKYTLGALVGMILVAGVIASLLNQPVVHYHPTHKMLFPQANFTVVPLDDNQVLLVGGGVPDKYGEKDKTNRAAQIYNAKEDHFYPAGSMHYQRGGSSWYGFTATHLKDGRVLIVGGQDPVTHEWIKAVELFDPKDRKFHEVPSISLPITAHSSTLLPSGEVLIIDETQGYIFNPKNQQLKKTPPLLIHQQNHSSVLLDKNRVLIVGSYSDYGESPPVAEYYDIQKNMFFKLSDTITGKYDPDLVRLPDGNVLVAGGYLCCPSKPKWIELFDAKKNIFKKLIINNFLAHDAYMVTTNLILLPHIRGAQFEPDPTWGRGFSQLLNTNRITLKRIGPVPNNPTGFGVFVTKDKTYFLGGSIEKGRNNFNLVDDGYFVFNSELIKAGI